MNHDYWHHVIVCNALSDLSIQLLFVCCFSAICFNVKDFVMHLLVHVAFGLVSCVRVFLSLAFVFFVVDI